jgi:methylated-DNA-[protein]-cysteine S-methyltransferase
MINRRPFTRSRVRLPTEQADATSDHTRKLRIHQINPPPSFAAQYAPAAPAHAADRAVDSNMSANCLFWDEIETPIGRLLLVGDAELLREVHFDAGAAARALAPGLQRNARAFENTKTQLTEYFRGARRVFDIPMNPIGTVFQRDVWQALGDIPFGETRSYSGVARSLGKPKAVRAVAQANGSNPLPIIIPCHRVIGADGSLTGFGGGLKIKHWLLEHESAGRGQLPLWNTQHATSAP